MTKEFTIKSLQEIDKVAEQFVTFISNSSLQSNIIAFFGAMGAGKTTFIKSICKVLGAKDNVNSPTFTIVNEYSSAKGFPIYHFDFYRINKIEEAYDIGVEEYFSGNGLCLIEWSEKIDSILPPDAIKVTITTNPDLSRTVSLSSDFIN